MIQIGSTAVGTHEFRFKKTPKTNALSSLRSERCKLNLKLFFYHICTMLQILNFSERAIAPFKFLRNRQNEKRIRVVDDKLSVELTELIKRSSASG